MEHCVEVRDFADMVQKVRGLLDAEEQTHEFGIVLDLVNHKVHYARLPLGHLRKAMGAKRHVTPDPGASCTTHSKPNVQTLETLETVAELHPWFTRLFTREQLQSRFAQLREKLRSKIAAGHGQKICDSAEKVILTGGILNLLAKLPPELRKQENIRAFAARGASNAREAQLAKMLLDARSYKSPRWTGVDFAKLVPGFKPQWSMQSRQEAEVEPGLVMSLVVWQGAQECPHQAPDDPRYFGYQYGNHDYVFQRKRQTTPSDAKESVSSSSLFAPQLPPLVVSSLTLHMMLCHNDWNAGPYQVDPELLHAVLFEKK